ADVTGGGIDEEVLTGAVAAFLPGDLGRCHEAVPAELVYGRVAGAVGVRHRQGNIVPRVGDHAVDQEVADGAVEAAPDLIEHHFGGTGVAADAAYVCLDCRKR